MSVKTKAAIAAREDAKRPKPAPVAKEPKRTYSFQPPAVPAAVPIPPAE